MYVNGQLIIPGDVLLKHSNQGASPKDFLVHGFIKATQKLQHLSGDASVVHAALFLGNDVVVEAVGAGLSLNNFDTSRTEYNWEFWRYSDAEIRSLAADLGMNLAERRATDTSATPFGGYATKPALKNALVGAKNRSDEKQANELENYLRYVGEDSSIAREMFFCSEIVTFLYHMASVIQSVNFKNVINLDYRSALPSKLKTALQSSPQWQLIGSRRGFTC